MPEQEPMTQTVTTSDAGRDFSRLVKQVSQQETRIVVEEDGRPVAAIISAKDLEQLEQLEAERAADFARLDEIGGAFRDIPPAELEREVSRALTEARQQARRERSARNP